MADAIAPSTVQFVGGPLALALGVANQDVIRLDTIDGKTTIGTYAGIMTTSVNDMSLMFVVVVENGVSVAVNFGCVTTYQKISSGEESSGNGNGNPN